MNISMKPGRSNRGFTILEILVVVAVISIIASTILLNTNLSRPDNELKKHANTLGKTLQLLMQEAIIGDRNYALSLMPGAYQVLEYDGNEWSLTTDPFFLSLHGEHEFHDELVIDQNIIRIEKSEKPQPHILILASGEMSIFEWNIEDRENNFRVRINSSLLGKITIEGPAETLL